MRVYCDHEKKFEKRQHNKTYRDCIVLIIQKKKTQQIPLLTTRFTLDAFAKVAILELRPLIVLSEVSVDLELILLACTLRLKQIWKCKIFVQK